MGHQKADSPLGSGPAVPSLSPSVLQAEEWGCHTCGRGALAPPSVQQLYPALGGWGWRCPNLSVLPSTQPESSTLHHSPHPAGASSCPWKPSMHGRHFHNGILWTKLPACFLHGANTRRTPWLPFTSLNPVLLYFHACRRRKKEGYLLSVHSQALKSWGEGCSTRQPSFLQQQRWKSDKIIQRSA